MLLHSNVLQPSKSEAVPRVTLTPSAEEETGRTRGVPEHPRAVGLLLPGGPAVWLAGAAAPERAGGGSAAAAALAELHPGLEGT